MKIKTRIMAIITAMVSSFVMMFTTGAIFPVSNCNASNAFNTALDLYIDYVSQPSEVTGLVEGLSNMWLVYIDDDDSPELVIDTGVVASGSTLLTVVNGELIIHDLAYGSINYMEGTGFFLNCTGRMGYYYDTIYQLENGELTIKHQGYYDDSDTPYFSYYWASNINIKIENYYVPDYTECSETRYYNLFKAIYNELNGVWLNSYMSCYNKVVTSLSKVI